MVLSALAPDLIQVIVLQVVGAQPPLSMSHALLGHFTTEMGILAHSEGNIVYAPSDKHTFWIMDGRRVCKRLPLGR